MNVLKWKKGLSISTGKFPVRIKNEVAKNGFPVSFLFYFLTFCVILGPPKSKCQDRIKWLWEKVGRYLGKAGVAVRFQCGSDSKGRS